MKILITNDDGINAAGLRALHGYLKKYTDDITVVAPSGQCSCAAHSLTGEGRLRIEKADFGFGGSAAYSVDGTPADCVRCAMLHILDEKPDYVFAGINDGANVGQNILYSATVSAAMEALVHGVRSAAFSIKYQADPTAIERTFMKVLDFILDNPTGAGEMYSVNFPGAADDEIRAINTNTHPSKMPYLFVNRYERESVSEDSFKLKPVRILPEEKDPDSDIFCVENNIASISKLKNIIL